MSRLMVPNIHIARSSKGSIIEMRYSPTLSISLSLVPCLSTLCLSFIRFLPPEFLYQGILGLKTPINRHGVYPITRRPPTYANDSPLQKIQDPLTTESDSNCPHQQSFVFTPSNPGPRGAGDRVMREWGKLSIHSRKITSMS